MGKQKTRVLWERNSEGMNAEQWGKRPETPLSRPEESESDRCQQPATLTPKAFFYLPEDLSCHLQDFRSSLKIPFTGQVKSTGESLQLPLSLIPPAFFRTSFLTMKCLAGAFSFNSLNMSNHSSGPSHRTAAVSLTVEAREQPCPLAALKLSPCWQSGTVCVQGSSTSCSSLHLFNVDKCLPSTLGSFQP